MIGFAHTSTQAHAHSALHDLVLSRLSYAKQKKKKRRRKRKKQKQKTKQSKTKQNNKAIHGLVSGRKVGCHE